MLARGCELVKYGAVRPESVAHGSTGVPGHVKALLAAHPEFSCTGTHPRHPVIFHGVQKEVLCAGNDAAIAFLEQVLDAVCELFPDAYVHIGGDECPKDAWKKCPSSLPAMS